MSDSYGNGSAARWAEKLNAMDDGAKDEVLGSDEATLLVCGCSVRGGCGRCDKKEEGDVGQAG